MCICLFACCAFSALTLLVGYQDWHLARKNLTDEVEAWLSSGAKCKYLAYGSADATATAISASAQEAQLSLRDCASNMFDGLHLKRPATGESPSRSFKVTNTGAIRRPHMISY